ncbi:unnamed protein product, partial [Phaeothamnion confervicola]
MDRVVEKRVRALVQACARDGSKFTDPDFGPNDSDEDGAKALYGDPPVPPGPVGASAYPKPEGLRWDRPRYPDPEMGQDGTGGKAASDGGDNDVDGDEYVDDDEDDEFAERRPEVWCKKGRLFVNGSASGDVVQGALGDCWFLGALSVVATREELLRQVFWRGETWRDLGLYVCRFHKDAAWRFVVIDDRIPCFDNRDGNPVFARCRDPNELWAPLVEKAYAKLHGCYKSLIGGYVHYGVSDLTGFAPRLLVLKRGHQGFHDDCADDDVWRRLRLYRNWRCLMGCSIQQPPGADLKAHEAEAGQGLRMMHAYALVDANEGQRHCVRLLRLRNPWGHGEWTGAWSDGDPWRQKYDAAIQAVFGVSAAERTEIDQVGKFALSLFVSLPFRLRGLMDGTFFMCFSDWLEHFSHLFVGLDFPDLWDGQRAKGRWDDDSGGNRELKTFSSNPKMLLELPHEADVFVGLAVHDTRLSMGNDYFRAPLQQVRLTNVMGRTLELGGPP